MRTFLTRDAYLSALAIAQDLHTRAQWDNDTTMLYKWSNEITRIQAIIDQCDQEGDE